ncbi:hypothetical protein AVEN_116604-1 [Araneus ventricosus]|uniref:Uncharacterized protein n=1 Tax=Araneus ventricosus TaxID=182803 RepID=A0A4Y2DFE8_ARAVE|nr:hypothetical protein AVEN_116604-1 [Araneus ventricosus]
MTITRMRLHWYDDVRGRGLPVVRSRLQSQKVLCSKPDSTENPSSMSPWCPLNLMSKIKRPHASHAGVARKFGDGCELNRRNRPNSDPG